MAISNNLLINWGVGVTNSTNQFSVAFSKAVYSVVVGHRYYNNYLFSVMKANLTRIITEGGPSVKVEFFYIALGS